MYVLNFFRLLLKYFTFQDFFHDLYVFICYLVVSDNSASSSERAKPVGVGGAVDAVDSIAVREKILETLGKFKCQGATLQVLKGKFHFDVNDRIFSFIFVSINNTFIFWNHISSFHFW